MENGTKSTRTINIEEDIKTLRTWLQKQPHMSENINDELLLPFIYGTKSIEIAKKKLETFCMIQNKYPDNFSFKFRDPLDPTLKDRYKMGKLFFLPKTTPEGYRVMMGMTTDFERFDGFWYNVIMSMVVESLMLMHPESPGLVLIFDGSNVDSRVMTKMGLSSVIFLMNYMQNAIPMKMKKAVIYNTPSFFDVFINTFIKPYAKKKLLDRVVFTSKGEEVLKEYVPVDILPSDIVGGKAPSTDELDAEWKSILVSRRDWFKKSSTLAIDESKRLPDAKNTYGVEGTFRKLNVD